MIVTDFSTTKKRESPESPSGHRWVAHWYCSGSLITIEQDRYFPCSVLPDRSGVVAITGTVVASNEALAFINADGSSRFTLGSIHWVWEQWVSAGYSWFEKSRMNPSKWIGVTAGFKALNVCDERPDIPMAMLEIDPNDGSLMHYHEIR